MCASYMIKQRLSGRFPLISEARIQPDEFFGTLIVPHRPAPVITQGPTGWLLGAMRFSLLPRWSKEPRVAFATHNARIESVAEKATWREAFRQRHCLVPLTHFIEPIYENAHAGFMVAFHRPDDDFLTAAGIWESWTDRNTGEVVESFAILTSEAPPTVAQVGHDRCPVFIGENHRAQWLASEGSDPKVMIDFLISCREVVNFEVERHRPMRPGWEKRRS